MEEGGVLEFLHGKQPIHLDWDMSKKWTYSCDKQQGLEVICYGR